MYYLFFKIQNPARTSVFQFQFFLPTSHLGKIMHPGRNQDNLIYTIFTT